MRVAPRWRKALRDIAQAPLRTALAVVAMAVGAFGVSTILTAYAILARELATTYSDTRPASAILSLDGVSDATVASARGLPGVLEAEARPAIRGRIRVGADAWAPLVLYVVRDFDALRADTFKRDAGDWPPGDEDVLLERSCLTVAGAEVGGNVTLRTADGEERSLRVAGSVHAAGLAPGWMDRVVTGFVGWRSVMRADARAETPQLLISVSQNRLDEQHIREVARRVQALVEAQGGKVVRVDVPPPGRHPHADQMQTFLFLLGSFGALTFVLSAVLVANMIHGLLIEQVRQIGVMKTLGATTGQLVALYLGQVSLLAVVALGLGVPPGVAAGRGYAQFSASMLNATIVSTAVPAWVTLLEGVAGILVPLMMALVPVLRAARLTIHQAFSDDAGQRPFGSRRFDRWLAQLKCLPRPFRLSLRTAFQRRGRLALTLGTLAAGGAVFVSALNVSAAWTRTLEADAQARRYDLDVRLAHPYPTVRVAAALATLPDVARAEYWPDASAVLVDAAGGGDARVSLVGPTANSTLIDLPLLSGRWLRPDDAGVVVINQAVLAREPALHVGADVALRVNGVVVSWRVVGVAKELDPHPTVYAASRNVFEASGQAQDVTRSLRVVTREHGPAAELKAARDMERGLRGAGIGILGTQPLSASRQAFADHLVILKSALIFAAALVVLVGGLGLTSTLTLNVIERTRELGILGAIGAMPRTLSRYVVFEAVVIGVLSWCLALLAAVPVTLVLDSVTGQIFIKAALDFFMSGGAAAAWLALVLVLASLSSFYPAWRAGRLTVREALAYE